MKSAFYITSFNDPASCAKLMHQLSELEVMNQFTRYLSDGSDDAHVGAYRRLCERYGYAHVRRENKGATDAKRSIVQHAAREGCTFMAQVSEDFELTTPETCHPAYVSGRHCFLKDSLTLLGHCQWLSHVHWSVVRGPGIGYHGAGLPSLGLNLKQLPAMTLAYIVGDVSLWNWPYTGRVSELAEIWRKGDALVPGCAEHENWCKHGGGEWKQQWVSHGRGACLLAHPVRHTNRIKPANSIP